MDARVGKGDRSLTRARFKAPHARVPRSGVIHMARKKGVPNIKKHKWTGGIDTPDEEDGPHTLPQAAGASSSADLNSTDHSRAPADGNSNGHLPYPSNHNAAQDSPPPPPAVVQARSPRAFVRPDLSDKPMLPPGLMDLFAEVYVPLWLRSVNDAQAPFVPRSQAETLRVSPLYRHASTASFA